MLGRPSGPARVAFFDAYPQNRGGAQRALRLMAGGLDERGWTVLVVVPGEGALPTELRADGVRTVVAAAPAALMRYGEATVGRARLAALLRLPAYWWRLSRVLRAEADALHAQDLRGLLLAGPAARLAGVPVVWHVHAASPHPMLNRLASLLTSRTVVSSPGLTVRGIPARRIHGAIPNGVPVPDDAPARVQQVPPRVLTLGRLDPVKQLDVLLDATALLRDRGVVLAVDVLGAEQPGYRAEARALEQQSERLGLTGVVRFRGHVDDPSPYLRSASVYVQPSRHEMQPLAVLEAMAGGLPVVASRAGGLPALVSDRVTGLLVPPGDASALADAIEQLLSDPQWATSLGVAGHARVRAEFGEAASTDRVEALYRELLGDAS